MAVVLLSRAIPAVAVVAVEEVQARTTEAGGASEQEGGVIIDSVDCQA